MAVNFFLPKIYPITDTAVSGLSHLEQLRLLIADGATIVQLRDKNLPSIDLFREAKACVEIARANHVKLIINDRVDIALALNADGVHLGQDDLPPSEARKVLGNDAIIGFSTHNVDQAIAARNLPVDYIAIGPVFPTPTKTDHSPPLGLDGVEKVRQAVDGIPLVAIGGIGLDSIGDVLSAGADSVAVISAILADGRITENMQSAMAAVKR